MHLPDLSKMDRTSALTKAIEKAIASEPVRKKRRFNATAILKLNREDWRPETNPLMTRFKIPVLWGKRHVELKPEEQISINFADTMRDLTRSKMFNGIWLHIPNEGMRGKLTAIIMRAMGMIPGVADYIIVWRYLDAYKVAFIEMKAGKNNQTPDQWHFQLWAESHGIPYHLCRASGDAIQALKDMEAIHG